MTKKKEEREYAKDRMEYFREFHRTSSCFKKRQMKNYHIYLNDKCLFKNLNQEEFDIIWGKIYYSYFKEELTYVECIDYACIQGKVEEHSY